jgi:hypothetical protein
MWNEPISVCLFLFAVGHIVGDFDALIKELHDH